ncbi:MAG: flagellar hook assembly protein FlgD [Planctomycetota bacterium]|jgi:flagellar basal-body rod modification protein FlgD
MDSLSAVAKASDIQLDYMRLLVTELQNQNPLEPLDNKEMTAQLAQFSQLQQLETMSLDFAKVLTAVERDYASSLIGKNVSFVAQTETGANAIKSDVVEQVYTNVDGEIFLIVGDYTVGLEDIISVRN